MTENLYVIEDCLLTMRRSFVDHRVEGMTFSGEEVTVMCTFLLELARMARLQAHEISRHRWNAEAVADRAETARIMAELQRPGSNIALFPSARRSFSDEQPGGGAA